MRYKTLGSTGISVSELSLGTWGIGGAGWDSTTEEDSLEAIQAMMDLGVNFIDTAPAYNGGVAEQMIGKAVKDDREKVYIATKTGTAFIDGTYVRDNSRENVFKQCEDSLRYLRTDYIDFLLIHWPDAKVEIGETMEAMNELKEQGKIHYLGVSNFSVEQIEMAEKYGKIDVVQPPYSMVNRSAEPLARWASEHNKGVMTYGSLGAGILTGVFRTLPSFDPGDNRSRFYHHFEEPLFSRVMKLLAVMDEISESHGQVPLSQIAINWNTQKSFVTTSIVGVQKKFQAVENCAGMDWMLSREEIERLDETIKTIVEA